MPILRLTFLSGHIQSKVSFSFTRVEEMGITKVTVSLFGNDNIVKVIVLLSVVRITEGCLGGFGGGGGQQCCPPHAAPICGSSCSSGGPIPR